MVSWMSSIWFTITIFMSDHNASVELTPFLLWASLLNELLWFSITLLHCLTDFYMYFVFMLPSKTGIITGINTDV